MHLFAVVRHKVSGVAATSHIEAVGKAIDQTDFYAECDGRNFEYAEELSHFLVDVMGDTDFEHSQWFYSQDNPLLANLRWLVNWYDQGQSQHELDAIIKSARDAISASV